MRNKLNIWKTEGVFNIYVKNMHQTYKPKQCNLNLNLK